MSEKQKLSISLFFWSPLLAFLQVKNFLDYIGQKSHKIVKDFIAIIIVLKINQGADMSTREGNIVVDRGC